MIYRGFESEFNILSIPIPEKKKKDNEGTKIVD